MLWYQLFRETESKRWVDSCARYSSAYCPVFEKAVGVKKEKHAHKSWTTMSPQVSVQTCTVYMVVGGLRTIGSDWLIFPGPFLFFLFDFAPLLLLFSSFSFFFLFTSSPSSSPLLPFHPPSFIPFYVFYSLFSFSFVFTFVPFSTSFTTTPPPLPPRLC